MAESIKKVLVPNSNLGDIDWDTEGYSLRYRIRSENKNLKSHWSPTYYIPVGPFFQVNGSLFETQGEDGKDIVTIIWDDVLGYASYDIYLAPRDGIPRSFSFNYDGETFVHYANVEGGNYSFVKFFNSQSFRVIVQPSTNIKRIKEVFIIFDSDDLLET